MRYLTNQYNISFMPQNGAIDTFSKAILPSYSGGCLSYYPRSLISRVAPLVCMHIGAGSVSLKQTPNWMHLGLGNCWYFVTSTSDTRLFSMIPVTASEMPGIGANNNSTFHITTTGNQAIMNHESFSNRTELRG